jgi:hypothetical protein
MPTVKKWTGCVINGSTSTPMARSKHIALKPPMIYDPNVSLVLVGGERRNTKQEETKKREERRERRRRERDPPLPPSNNHLSLLPSIATKALQVLVLVGVKDGRKNKS